MEFRELRSEASKTLQIFYVKGGYKFLSIILYKRRANTFHHLPQRVGKVKYSFTSSTKIRWSHRCFRGGASESILEKLIPSTYQFNNEHETNHNHWNMVYKQAQHELLEILPRNHIKRIHLLELCIHTWFRKCTNIQIEHINSI